MPNPFRLPARVFLLAGLAALGAQAGQAADRPVSEAAIPATVGLDRAFASPALDGTAPRRVRLSPDGKWLTLLKNRTNDRDRYDLWGYERATGKWRMLVDSAKLGSGAEISEAEKMQRERLRIGGLKGIVAYDWAADGKALLVPLDGRLYRAGLDGTVQEIKGAGEGALNPQLSPGGRFVTFVRDRRVFVGSADGTAESAAITPAEASETVHWGEAEFVAQEEMHRFAGAWWAGDDSRIAIERFDEAPVGVVTRAAIGAEGTRTYSQRYPAAGTPNATVSLWVMKPDGSARVQVDLGADPDIYLARVDWAPDGKTLYVQRQNRAQTRLDMLAVDPETGAARVLFSEEAAEKSWINLSDSYRFLKDGSLIWWSERDGFGHLWHFAKGQWRQLTKGPWTVTGLIGVDQKAGRLFFTGTRDTVLEGHVYALDLAAPDKVTRLTEAGFDNAAVMDRGGQTLVVSRSADRQPSQTYLADSTGKRLAWIEENKVAGAHPYVPFLPAHRPAEFGTIAADDGTPLHWMMIKPVMEPGKRYPVFFHHYGGPGSQQVRRAWQGALAQAIVARGYIYVALDNRGSPNRGVSFERAIWHGMGGVEVADQLAGAKWLKSLPFVDPARLATFGWSYGGYMTLKMLAADPGVYAAGIAVAPVTKWGLYDTHYTERYMGDPRAVPEAYARADALDGAKAITDPLLVIHGMADDNVVFENATALAATLQQSAVPFEMMFYPGATHSISGGKLRQHLYETVMRFLDKHGVGPGGR